MYGLSRLCGLFRLSHLFRLFRLFGLFRRLRPSRLLIATDFTQLPGRSFYLIEQLEIPLAADFCRP